MPSSPGTSQLAEHRSMLTPPHAVSLGRWLHLDWTQSYVWVDEAVRKDGENWTPLQFLSSMAQKLWINGLIEKSSLCTFHLPETPTNDSLLPVNPSVNHDSLPLQKPGNHLRPHVCSLSSVISQTPVIYTAVNSTLATRQSLICHPFC